MRLVLLLPDRVDDESGWTDWSRIKGGHVASAGVRPEAAMDSSPSFLSRDSPSRTLVLSLLLAFVTMAVYWPVHEHPFLNLDDPKYVTQNPHIANGLTPGTVVWAFTHGYAANWHPLTWVSHAIDVQLFGLDPSPQHDESVILHALDAVLLFWVLKRATGYAGRSFMVAALFALHPVNVESVAWIAERKTILSTMFCLLALGAYRWYASKPSAVRYVVMTGLFVLGLMSKPQIIMLPLVLLLWDYWPLERLGPRSSPFALREDSAAGISAPTKNEAQRSGEKPKANRDWRWLVMEKIPLFFICLVDAGVTMIAQHVAGEKQPYTLWIRIENALVSYTRYIRNAFWPTKLALYYPHPGTALRWWQTASAMVVLLLITVLAWRARRHRYYIVGWLWFLIMLVPCIGLVQADVQGMADRYAYVSFIGLFIMVCWGVADLASEQHLPKAVLPAISVVVLAALMMVTRQQIGYWQDNIALWAHSIQVTIGNWKAEYLLGGALIEAGRQDEAYEHYLRAAAIEPADPSVNLNLATYEEMHGNLVGALEHYKKGLANSWNSDQSTKALNGMAVIYREMGDAAKADACLAKRPTQSK
jgi:tetratricopeptide (TPR) repeat protein